MKKVLIILLILIILTAGGWMGYKYWFSSNNSEPVVPTEEQQKQDDEPIVVELNKEPEKVIKTYNGTDRPIAVMIDNNVNAWPQAGLNDAYLVSVSYTHLTLPTKA